MLGLVEIFLGYFKKMKHNLGSTLIGTYRKPSFGQEIKVFGPNLPTNITTSYRYLG